MQHPGTAGRDRESQRSLPKISVATFGTQSQTIGNLFNGNEASARIDYNWNASNRFFVKFNC